MNNTILDDQLTEGNDFAIASRGKRFANYLIDYVFFLVFIMFIGGLLAFIIADLFLATMTSSAGSLLINVVTIVIFLIYYILMEYFFAGKTLGKLITKTRAVTTGGDRMSFGTVVKRSLCRIVPFEQFSFFGSEPILGWHDSWSGTKVIDETKRYKDSQSI